MHTPKHAIIAQLEVGTDTPSFEQALRQGLRQDPDVVLVGELRDMDTLRIALRAADTGHQVFSTVHSASPRRRSSASSPCSPRPNTSCC